MKSHEFYSKYANTPLPQRDKVILNGGITLNQLYVEMKEIDDRIRPDVIRKDTLLGIARNYYITYE